MTDETMRHENPQRGITRRTIMRGAAWSVPVVAATVATPLAAASVVPTPTDISVTLAPSPPVPGNPVRLTYRGTADFEEVLFPAGSTAILTVSGTFTGTVINGATIASQSGTNPVVYTLAITNLERFYVQGVGQAGSSVAVAIYDGTGREIGSDFTAIGNPV